MRSLGITRLTLIPVALGRDCQRQHFSYPPAFLCFAISASWKFRWNLDNGGDANASKANGANSSQNWCLSSYRDQCYENQLNKVFRF